MCIRDRSISASLGKDKNGKQIQLGQAVEELKKYDWYKNPGPGVRVKEGGDAEDMADMFNQFSSAITVSYTHLDVYKRQACYFI